MTPLIPNSRGIPTPHTHRASHCWHSHPSPPQQRLMLPSPFNKPHPKWVLTMIPCFTMFASRLGYGGGCGCGQADHKLLCLLCACLACFVVWVVDCHCSWHLWVVRSFWSTSFFSFSFCSRKTLCPQQHIKTTTITKTHQYTHILPHTLHTGTNISVHHKWCPHTNTTWDRPCVDHPCGQT